MSRIAKKPIVLPANTEITLAQGVLTVKGPLGTLSRPVVAGVDVTVADGKAQVAASAKSGAISAHVGTTVAHLKNMIAGVNKLFEKRLIIEGIGFKAEIKGNEVVLALGFSHPIKLAIPAGITAVNDKAGLLISGMNKDAVGQFASYIRSLKKPEPYKGKGVRYEGEVIRRKQGKKAA